jgi:hypothetical protein
LSLGLTWASAEPAISMAKAAQTTARRASMSVFP